MNKENRIKYFLFVSVCFLIIFILAIIVWYSPVLFKGHAPYKLTDGPLLARNFYQDGQYSIENDLNVLLAPNLIKDQGIPSAGGNKLTIILYSKIFKITGLFEADDLIWLSIFIYALTLLIFTGIVLYLFNLKTALIFSLIYIFLPFNWNLPYYFCTYEFALFFLSLFFLFYLHGVTKKQQLNYIYLIVSGIFLALACLSRETLLLIIPFLLIYLWIKYPKKYLLYIFIPFVILFSFFWLPNINHDAYLQVFTIKTSEEIKSADFNFYGHIYPDPYTYHFEQNEFLENIQKQINSNDLVLAKEIDLNRELKNIGIAEISLIDRTRAGLTLGFRHLFRFISLEDIGGPFIFLLIILGLYSLRDKNKSLNQFFIYWIFSTIFLMSFIALVGRNHLMDFNWAIALLVSLGLLVLIDLLINYFKFENKKATTAYLVVLFIILYHLITVGHIVWSRNYNNNSNLMIKAYSQEVKSLNIEDKDVIAVNLNSPDVYYLNYLTNKSVVLFRPETIDNLLIKNKLNFAFEQFNIKYILGYSDELTEEIINKSNVTNVASNSLKPIISEISRNKSWLMNLIK